MSIAWRFLGLLVFGAAAPGQVMPLAGEWRFSLDPDTQSGQSIPLPGSTDDARLGTMNTAKPTLDGLYRLYSYEGPAWYQREVLIPPAWKGKRIRLFLERTHGETRVWVDGRQMGSQDSLIAPHVYDLSPALTPGKHSLRICVDNTKKIDLGRFVSINYEGTQTNWNGLIGRLELQASDPVWIEDVQVYPDVDKGLARVRVRLGNAGGGALDGRLALSAVLRGVGGTRAAKNVVVRIDAAGAEAAAELELGSRVKLWDEFSPNLYELSVALSAGRYTDRKTVTFGMRRFATKGTQFTLNGRTIFLRGTLECAIFPKSGYPPMDVGAWRRIYQVIKSYGLNHMRFHSWTPPEAAFTAADLEGVLLQTEGPQANVPAGRDAQRDAFLEQEMLRIVRTYGNHPSFVMLTPGNEFGGPAELLSRWVEMLKNEDPRHLYSTASNNANVSANREFTVRSAPRGIKGPATDVDFRDVIEKQDRPLVGHEIGQWTFFPNPAEKKKYSGVLDARNFDLIWAQMKEHHLLDLEPRIFQATGRHATLLYKEEMELLLRTPGHAGFALLDLHDYPGQGTALIGVLDPFWDSKGFVTPAGQRRYCGPTVPLLRMKKRTFTTAEDFEAQAEVAHFGASGISRAAPAWMIRDALGRKVAGGTLPPVALPTGKLTALGAVRAALANAHAPAKLTVSVTLEGTAFRNDWEIWVYPAAAIPPEPAGVTVTRSWAGAKEALSAGKTVLLLPRTYNQKNTLPGKFLPVFWSPVWFPNRPPATMGILTDPKHPALAGFPTDFHSNWQWWELLQASRTLVLEDTPAAFRPIVQVIDNISRNQRLGNLLEARVGPGKLLLCSIDLPGLAEQQPAARQLLRSLYTYAGSPKFQPSHTLELSVLDGLF